MLVGALYRCMGDFGKFVPLTLLYFAAASFAEASRRLGRSVTGSAARSSDVWAGAAAMLPDGAGGFGVGAGGRGAAGD